MLAGQGAADADGLGHGLGALGRGDHAGLDHFVQHHGGARRRALGVGDRRVARGRLEQSGQKRGLAHRQILGTLVEIPLRGRFDAIGPAAEIDAVQIQGEDLFLGEFQLQPDGQHQFLHLAAHILIRRQEQVLGQLLGQGRAALHHPLGPHIGDQGPSHADGVEAGVIIKPLVLDGDEGGGHIVGQGGQVGRRCHLGAARGDQRPGAIQIGDRGLAIDFIQAGGVGQVACEDGEEHNQEDHAPDRQHRGPIDQRAKERPTGPGRSRAGAAGRAPSTWRLSWTGHECPLRPDWEGLSPPCASRKRPRVKPQRVKDHSAESMTQMPVILKRRSPRRRRGRAGPA